jgi:hypothetical protein
MFPRFREQIGTALDLIVEFSTLGEYRLGTAFAGPGAPGAPADAPGQAPQMGGAGEQPGAAGSAGGRRDFVERAAVRRTVAGGAAGFVPVATPAARRSCRVAGPSQRLREARTPRPREGASRPREGATRPREGATRPREGATRPREGGPRPRRRTGAPAVAEQLCLAV